MVDTTLNTDHTGREHCKLKSTFSGPHQKVQMALTLNNQLPDHVHAQRLLSNCCVLCGRVSQREL